MSATAEVQSGLEGVVAFATEIAEPDREGGALRYRGVDIEDLVGNVPFGQVWGLLVDGKLLPGMPPAEPHPLHVHSGDPRVDVQSALAMLGPQWGFQSLIDISDEEARDDLARASVMALSVVAQCARGTGAPPVPQREVDKATSIPERFLVRWRGEANPDHVKAIDAYWISAAEHGMNASTFTARVIASTGADCAAALSGAIGALSGPLHGGAPSRVLKMLDEVEQTGDAEKWVKDAVDRGDRLMGFGHGVYRAEDGRAKPGHPCIPAGTQIPSGMPWPPPPPHRPSPASASTTGCPPGRRCPGRSRRWVGWPARCSSSSAPARATATSSPCTSAAT